MAFHSGFLALVGRSNVGKSTLMNKMIGEKVAIVSPKAQTTRSNIQGVLTREDWQAVFVDTPGIHKPRTRLGQYMEKQASQALNDMDAVLFVVDGFAGVGQGDKAILERLGKCKCPVIAVVNKVDAAAPAQVMQALEAFKGEKVDHVVPLSAQTGEGVDILVELIHGYLPEGPRYFPEDMITDQPERVLAAELIREKALRLLDEEVPHGIGVEIMAIQNHKDRELVEINATIYCDKMSHKPIIIGKKGAMLREIGSQARPELEMLFGRKVYLELWVKVQENWRNRASDLKTLGYTQD